VTRGNAVLKSDENETLAHLVLEACSVAVLVLIGPAKVVLLC
jgi:hypothetical protein